MATTATLTPRRLAVNGVDITLLTAGTGDPLLFLHGAGTFSGYPFASQWADRFRVLVPYHPGFGDSADDPQISEMHDYVLHYLELLDQLGLDRVDVVGHSLGGWIAARLAVEHSRRIRKLVLVCPAGLHVPEHPTTDLFSVPPEEVLGRLVADPAVLRPWLPEPLSVDFQVSRYRESTSLARVLWERPYDRKLGRWLHRITVPTLVLWGEADRLIPPEQAPVWAARLPQATVRTFPGVGHSLLHESPAAVTAVREFLAGD